ncbi:Medium-chain acyl-CoA ligase ACSF2, mitochondrial [Halotydeus destructor]|nr:Medium-chain acyl-CoA ligase ACSF2, mitochondrial [Halotydeus destructor]
MPYPCSKLSYAFGTSGESLRGETVPEVLSTTVTEYPDRLAIVSMHQGIEKTYVQFDEDVSSFSSALLGLGVTKGNRVGIWSANCYEWVVTQFATAKMGAILVNINPGCQDLELSHCLNLVGCHTLISGQRYTSSNQMAVLERASPGITNITGHRVTSNTIPSLKNLIYIDSDDNTAPCLITRFSQLLTKGEKQRKVSNVQISMDDVVNILFTSGTTGKPKGATLSHFNYVNNARFMSKRFYSGLSKKVICMPAPLHHIFGCVSGILMGLSTGSTIILPAPSPDTSKSIDAIEKHGCTVMYGSPTMFIDILDSPDLKNRKLDSLETAIMGGASCPPEVARKLQTVFTNLRFLCNPYGATETSPGLACTEPSECFEANLDNVGMPLDHVEVKLIDVNGCTVPRGSPGEILARGHNIMVGYWNQEEKTKEVIDSARWYHTGDTGVMAENGSLSIVGRIKEMIIRGGENIYPREVEDALAAHPHIADINVVGVPDKRLGEELCACVIMQPGFTDLNSRDIRDFLLEKVRTLQNSKL